MKVGLYIHIPFCSFLCHYCDFAKTANFDAIQVQDYFALLAAQYRALVERLEESTGRRVSFSSVYFGGGTPGLFTSEYATLLHAIQSRMDAGCEVSMECNPNNINPSALATWKSLGVNRLSIGVQTLQSKGLEALTRDHDASSALRALETALGVIPNVNMDLIYGWPGQTATEWADDLAQLVRSGVPHASLYSLTYEDRTPFGRMARRGKIHPASDDSLAARYTAAREVLGDAGFEHDEVSNWARPGFTCHHNWLYWDFKHFIGIGAGAHGFLPRIGTQSSASDPDEVNIGLRYFFPRDFRTLLRRGPASQPDDPSMAALITSLGGEIDEGRDADAALIEYVGGSLRTRHGIDLSFCEKITGQAFSARPAIVEALRREVAWREGSRLRFDPAEWFRENSWAGEVLLSF